MNNQTDKVKTAEKRRRENNPDGYKPVPVRNLSDKKAEFTIGTQCERELTEFDIHYQRQIDDLIRNCDEDML